MGLCSPEEEGLPIPEEEYLLIQVEDYLVIPEDEHLCSGFTYSAKRQGFRTVSAITWLSFHSFR